MTIKLDPDILLQVLTDGQTIEEAKPRANQINKLLGVNEIPRDGHTFIAMVMILCAADKIGTCPLGPDRLGLLVAQMRARLDFESSEVLS